MGVKVIADVSLAYDLRHVHRIEMTTIIIG